MAKATQDLKQALAALPKEVLDALPAEHRQTLLAQTLDADTILDENMNKEDAAMVLLRISSLFAAEDIRIEWTPQLEALSLLDDKKLAILARKALNLPCFKFGGSAKTEPKSKKEEKAGGCPL